VVSGVGGGCGGLKRLMEGRNECVNSAFTDFGRERGSTYPSVIVLIPLSTLSHRCFRHHVLIARNGVRGFLVGGVDVACAATL